MAPGLADGAPQLEGGSDGTTIGNVGDSLKVYSTGQVTVGGLAVSKYKVDYDGSVHILTTDYATVYSYSGSGVFYGLSVKDDDNKSMFRLKIDGIVVFEDISGEIINLFTADDKSMTGPYLTVTGDGRVITFRPLHPLRYTTSVVLEAKGTAGKKVLGELIGLTKET